MFTNVPRSSQTQPTITVDDVEQQLQVVLGLLHQVPRLNTHTHTHTLGSVKRFSSHQKYSACAHLKPFAGWATDGADTTIVRDIETETDRQTDSGGRGGVSVPGIESSRCSGLE